MMLSDKDIQYALTNQEIGITPFNIEQLQPASYDVTLSKYFADPWGNSKPVDLREPVDHLFAQDEQTDWTLGPGDFLLGSLQESIFLGPKIAAQVAGKSSLGRLGLMIHVTAGFVDPGWNGHLTLELYNCSPWDLRLHAGMKIGQVTFYRLESPSLRVYGDPALGSKHMGEQNPRPMISQYYKNFHKVKEKV